MAWKDMVAPRVGASQTENYYGIIQEQPLEGWLFDLSANVDALILDTWQGWTVAGTGETMTVGPLTGSNTNTGGVHIGQYMEPVVFPTAGALSATFTIPALGNNLHIVQQGSTRPGVVQTGTWPVHGIKLELLVNNQFRFIPGSAPVDAWNELSQYNSTRFSNNLYHGQAGATTGGWYVIITDLAPGVYRLRPTFGLASANALPGTGTQVLAADAGGTGSFDQYHFRFKVGG